jgi:hypothetical protein
MQYQIIKNSGILLDGSPMVLTKDLTLEFYGAKDGAEVIINTGEKVLYRNISEGKIVVNRDLLWEGVLYVTVGPGIACDRLYVTREGNMIIVSGDYTEREAVIKKLRADVSSLNERVEKLERKLREIYDGHELL